MFDVVNHLAALRRPRLLIRAARMGVADYKRERDLCRLMKIAALPSPRHAVSTLLEEEGQLEEVRKSGNANYSPMRHVEVLIALMAEARSLHRAGPELM